MQPNTNQELVSILLDYPIQNYIIPAKSRLSAKETIAKEKTFSS
jgi:hypothetical protein